MPIHASMTLKCKIAVTTDTSFRGREVQPGVDPRAQPDWAYEFPDRTGPDTQICRTGPAGPD